MVVILLDKKNTTQKQNDREKKEQCGEWPKINSIFEP